MGYNFTSDREERLKLISDRIRDFAASGSTSLEIQLYKDEIPKLEKDINEIIITRGKPSKLGEGKYWCKVFKKRVVK